MRLITSRAHWVAAKGLGASSKRGGGASVPLSAAIKLFTEIAAVVLAVCGHMGKSSIGLYKEGLSAYLGSAEMDLTKRRDGMFKKKGGQKDKYNAWGGRLTSGET